MEAHHGHHGQEVSAGNQGQEGIALVIQKEMEIEEMLAAAKAEAEKIVEDAKRRAQEIKNRMQQAKAKAAGQNNPGNGQSARTAEAKEADAPAGKDEEEEIARLSANAEENIKKVVAMVLQEVIP